MADHTQKAQGARLREARKSAGFSTAAAFAERVGLDQTRYTQYERGVRSFMRDPSLLRRFSDELSVGIEWLLFGESAQPTPAVVDTSNIPVVGIVQAGAWLESDGLWPSEEEWIPVVPDPRYEPHRQWAVLVKGDSVNEVIQDGEYAHCVDIDCGRAVEEGDFVVVERVRQQGGLVETTIKQVKSNGNGPELWPRSTNRKYNGPIHIGHEDEEDIEVRIKGFVIGAYRKL